LFFQAALRQITDKAREFGANSLFNQILPLLMSPTLEDQERHLLVKVIDRILYKLDDLVRPYVHKILVVIEPLLIDEDYYARVEGREIISNLAKVCFSPFLLIIMLYCDLFLPRDTMLSAVYAVVVCLYVCLCVCVCHTRYCIKMAKSRIMQIMPHNKSRTLVYTDKRVAQPLFHSKASCSGCPFVSQESHVSLNFLCMLL